MALAAAMVKLDSSHEYLSVEEKRLKEDREKTKYWKKWGPYVAERQWATGWSIIPDGWLTNRGTFKFGMRCSS